MAEAGPAALHGFRVRRHFAFEGVEGCLCGVNYCSWAIRLQGINTQASAAQRCAVGLQWHAKRQLPWKRSSWSAGPAACDWPPRLFQGSAILWAAGWECGLLGFDGFKSCSRFGTEPLDG